MNATLHSNRAHRGFVLVSAILLLLVMSLLAVSMFRSFGMQEKISGNVREKQRALHAANAAELYAEAWLRDNATMVPAACTSGLVSVGLGQQICSNSYSTLTGGKVTTTVPWTDAAGVDVGVKYIPSSMVFTDTGNNDTVYHAAPRFYIEHKGPSAIAGQGQVYQIDAVGYGGNKSAVAVVRSTFSVYTDSWDPSK